MVSQAGETLNNSVTWAWTGGSFTTSAPNVRIVEPDLDINKSALPTTVAAGTPIYIYEVRENRTVSPSNISVFKHEEDSWLTLITCKTIMKRPTDMPAALQCAPR
jgi:hypothetical protein